MESVERIRLIASTTWRNSLSRRLRLRPTRPPISQPAAFDAAQGCLCPLPVRYTQTGAMVVSEIEFRKVPLKVLFAAVLVDALHAALEYRKEALNRIRVRETANVFFPTV